RQVFALFAPVITNFLARSAATPCEKSFQQTQKSLKTCSIPLVSTRPLGAGKGQIMSYWYLA
ncbi:MAG: hypothetical protein LBH24_01550, partial [Clostridiales bacterium]|nr:hypothetical protein [Clostridiales bacterium]